MRVEISSSLEKKTQTRSMTSPESDKLLELREEASRIARMLERDEISVQEASRRLRALTEMHNGMFSLIFGR